MLNFQNNLQLWAENRGALVASEPITQAIGKRIVKTQTDECENGERRTGNTLVAMRESGKTRLTKPIRNQLGKGPSNNVVNLKMRFMPLMVVIAAVVAVKQSLNFLPLITWLIMAQLIGVRLVRVVASEFSIGSGKTVIPKDSKYFAGIVNGVNVSQVCAHIREPLTTSLIRRRAKRLEAGGTRKGDDIVCSVWQHAAAISMAEQEVAHLFEHKGSWRITLSQPSEYGAT